MTVEMESWQWIELLDKLNNVADKSTQSQILNTLSNILSSVAKELKQDTVISLLNSISSKLDAIQSSLGVARPTYSVTVLASSVAANKHHIVLFNGNPNNVVAIRKIIISAETTAAVTGFIMGYRVNRISAVSGGTSLSINKFDTNDPDVSNIISVTNPTSVTVVATLAAISINPEETGGNAFAILDFDSGNIRPIILRQNQGISIQQYATAGVGSVSITIIFTVEPP